MKKAVNIEDQDLIEEPGAGVGHNSVAKEELSRVVQSIELLLDERHNVNEDIKAALEVAVQKGLDKTAIRDTIKARAADPQKREERESLRDLYLNALGPKG